MHLFRFCLVDDLVDFLPEIANFRDTVQTKELAKFPQLMIF